MASSATESTPLLASSAAGAAATSVVTADPNPRRSGFRRRLLPSFSPIARVYIVSLVGVITFSVTQTALIYSFRTMTCDVYYEKHPENGDAIAMSSLSRDRCAIPAIDSKTAKSVAIMSGITTACTVINLFISAAFIDRYGVKAAMFQQTLWAALRNLTQIYAENLGGAAGMRIITTTQLFNILGSGGGMQLCANSYVAMLSSDEERTGNLGVFGGIAMGGAAIGYALGGVLERYVGPLAPFHAAFFMLVFCTIFGMLFLPYRAPQAEVKDRIKDSTTRTPHAFLGPLRFFVPRKVTTESGRSRRDWNLFFLGLGTFCSVLATGYIAMALQLVATNVFGFTPDTSGYMLSLTLLVRAFFLMVCFPRIIARGRKWLSGGESVAPSGPGSPSASPMPSPTPTLTEHPEDPNEAEVPDATGGPVIDSPPSPTDVPHGSTFDLLFLRYSILLDGILTGATTFASQDWHMYLAAAVLPFASGTGPASKGVTLEFVAAAERPAALSAIALVEKIAQVTTIGLFGTAFAWLSELGHPTWVFMLDAGVALVAFVLLLPVRMPRVSAGTRTSPARSPSPSV